MMISFPTFSSMLHCLSIQLPRPTSSHLFPSILLLLLSSLLPFSFCSSSLSLLLPLSVSASPSSTSNESAVSTSSSVSSPKTLVLYENNNIQSTHSLFFAQLQARGHSLTFASVYSDSPRLERYGEYYFSNLILLCPTAEDFGEYISPSTISSFIDSGRHVLVVLNENVTEPHREILNDIGIEIEEEFKMVIDHFHYDDQLDHGEHTVVTSSKLTQARSIIHPSISRPVSPVLFRGIGHSFIDPSSPLNVPILTAESTSYSGLVGEQVTDISQAVGEDVLLVSGVQTLNNARVAVIGSVELMGNEYMKAASDDSKDSKKDNKDGKLSGNGVLVEQVSKWVFGDQGVLRARELKHKQVSGNEHNPHGYRVLDQVQFSIIIEEWDGNRQSWVPFLADDVQLEFTMIDPYFRVTLPHDSKLGVYTHNFTIPDVYGVFKFVIDYHRIGYSHLLVSHTVPVHPFRHDEFERFILQAYPYYSAVFTLMAAFFVFGIVFLYQKE